MLTLTIDRRDKAPVYEQVADQVRRLIASGELSVGAVLPPVRRLAGDLGVGLNTIARAYRTLSDEGFLVTRDRARVEVAAPAKKTSGPDRAGLLDGLRVALARLAQSGMSTDELSRVATQEIRALGSRGTGRTVMGEAAVVNFFIVVRTFIVGGFLIILPLITRKGLLFGVYIGEDAADGEPARQLVRRWQRACMAFMVVAIIAGFGVNAAGWPLTGSLTCVGVLLVLGAPLYIRMHSEALALAPPTAREQGEVAIASLEHAEPRAERIAKLALWTCILAGLAFVTHAAMSYSKLPEMVPTYFGLTGDPSALSEKSFGTVMVPSVLSLVAAPAFALLALLCAGAKRSIRGGSGGGSVAAQAAFQGVYANLLSGTALFTCANLGFLSVQFVRLGVADRSWGVGALLIPLAMVVYAATGLIRILTRYGQGGSRLEEGSVEAPLTNGIADDSHWVWGVIYFNRGDPSLMVEARFGLGYTMNFGNMKSVALVVTFPVLVFGLLAVAIISAGG